MMEELGRGTQDEVTEAVALWDTARALLSEIPEGISPREQPLPWHWAPGRAGATRAGCEQLGWKWN